MARDSTGFNLSRTVDLDLCVPRNCAPFSEPAAQSAHLQEGLKLIRAVSRRGDNPLARKKKKKKKKKGQLKKQ